VLSTHSPATAGTPVRSSPHLQEVDTWFGDKKQYLQDLESALEACLKTSGTVLVKEKGLFTAPAASRARPRNELDSFRY
jgi:hypothetical protein